MAQYWVKHKCGHEVIHHLQGRHDDRQRKVAFLEGTPCMECRGRAGAGVADAAGLPPLSGTARQIPWAEEIRGRLHTSGATVDAMEEIRAVRDDGTRSTLMSIVDGIWATAEASWWIDHRQCGFRELVRRIDSEMASERIESAQLPPLSGTADQVAEAEHIRASMHSSPDHHRLARSLTAGGDERTTLRGVLRRIWAVTDASWWVGQAGVGVGDLLVAVYKGEEALPTDPTGCGGQ